MLARMQGRCRAPPFSSGSATGEIGGVVLFNTNFGSAGPAEPWSRPCRRRRRRGSRPPLLIAVDQEGGIVKRLPGAPSLSPPQMRSATIAAAQGLATARNLSAFGVNTDLAPVLDVGRGGFITPRSFGLDAGRGRGSRAGLRRRAWRAVTCSRPRKHFPGLGYATLNTDQSVGEGDGDGSPAEGRLGAVHRGDPGRDPAGDDVDRRLSGARLEPAGRVVAERRQRPPPPRLHGRHRHRRTADAGE